MTLSDRLIPDNILGDRTFRAQYIRVREKSDAFVELA